MDVSRRSPLICVALVLVLISALVGVAATYDLTKVTVYASRATEPTGPTYTCGDPNGGHCFSLAYWQGSPFDGISSDINIRQLESCCDSNFISNKMYMTSSLSNHWMEIGYRTNRQIDSHLAVSSAGVTNMWYFWADKRPIDNRYYLRYLGEVLVPDWGTTGNFYIERVGPSSFDAVVDIARANLVGHSTDNTIYPGWIDIGTQLTGTSGSDMVGVTHWTNNMWKAPPGYYCGPNTPWCFQTSNGSTILTHPATIPANWVVLPSQSTTGGDWRTSCCSTDADATP
jgi:hypothetical protein